MNTKSIGLTRTEELLKSLCNKTFLDLWCFANPFNSRGKELCDVIACFDNKVFLFFDRESKILDRTDKDLQILWKRWEKEVIQKQIKTAIGAERYIFDGGELFFDENNNEKIPLKFDKKEVQVFKIIVAHGAKQRILKYSDENITGSLAINYSSSQSDKNFVPFPFFLDLKKEDKIHVFDSESLDIILTELDTFFDFHNYLIQKEEAIQKFDSLLYCGEEDLLFNYYNNFDKKENKHFIGDENDEGINSFFIAEGQWVEFIKSERYKAKQKANEVSVLWDNLILRSINYLNTGETKGNKDFYSFDHPIFKMSEEPRFVRRAISERIKHAIKAYPEDNSAFTRMVSGISSFFPNRLYVFLQTNDPKIKDYENDYRPLRIEMLKIASAVALDKFYEIKEVVGIAIDAPKHNSENSEDFLMLKSDIVDAEIIEELVEANKTLGFFNSVQKLPRIKNGIKEFPS